MDSVPARAFFSQVYDDRVEKSREWIASICAALDIETFHLSGAASQTPGEEANRLIQRSDFLIALCTKKIATNDPSKFHTSQSVIEEIATARSNGKPILCFFENGVEVSGFLPSSSTYTYLENAENLTVADMAKIIRAVHETKLQSISRSDDIPQHTSVKSFTIPALTIVIELKNEEEGLYWEYTIERMLKFQEDYSLPILTAAYCMEHHEGCETPPHWKMEVERDGRLAETEHEVSHGFGSVEIRTRLIPPPKKNENVFIRERYRSPFLATIAKPKKKRDRVAFNGKHYDAYDGMAIISRVQALRLKYIFPKGFEITNVSPIVSTFSSKLDFPHTGEIERLLSSGALKVDEFDRQFTVELLVERPYYQYFYGVGWNAPDETELPNPIAQTAPPFEPIPDPHAE